MNFLLKLLEDRELTLRECILWDPWVCISSSVGGTMLWIGILLSDKAVGWPLILCSCVLGVVDVLRMSYLWCRRKSFDFSKSRNFFKRYAGVVTGIEVADMMVMIIALVAILVDVYLLK